MPLSTAPTRVLLAGALMLSLALAACGDDDTSTDAAPADAPPADAPPADAGTGDAAATDAVDIADFSFQPANITVPVGTTITFSNKDSAAHTATARDNSFNTESIDGGAEASITLDAAGEFAFFCAFHPFMEGTIVVG